MKQTIALNIFSSVLLQVVTIISGLIIPKMILNTFGSTVNGLITSLNQFLNYISLLEGGVASVMMANMYKPLYDRDDKQLSSVINTVKKFFKRLSFILCGYILVLALVYPLIIKNDLEWIYVSSLTLILGINLFIQYCFSYTYKLLLDADNKIYITAFTHAVVVILNTVAVYFGIKLFPSIHVVKIITSIVYLIQPIVYIIYVNKHYKIDKLIPSNEKNLKQRWDGFGINLAAFIHVNTDVVVLSLFSTLPTVSVYGVYSLVIMGINALIGSMMGGLVPTLGRKIAKADRDELIRFFDYYEYFCMLISSVAFTIGSILVVPFVQVYTYGVTDANYYQPQFAVIILLAEAFYCFQRPYINMAYQSGVFCEISKYAYTEAVLNIGISIVLVSVMGLVGVAIGTLISMAYRTIMQVYYLKDHLIRRSPKYFWKYIGVFFIAGFLSYCFFTIVQNTLSFGIDWGSFILMCLIATILTGIVFFMANYIFFKKKMLGLMCFIVRRS